MYEDRDAWAGLFGVWGKITYIVAYTDKPQNFYLKKDMILGISDDIHLSDTSLYQNVLDTPITRIVTYIYLVGGGVFTAFYPNKDVLFTLAEKQK